MSHALSAPQSFTPTDLRRQHTRRLATFLHQTYGLTNPPETTAPIIPKVTSQAPTNHLPARPLPKSRPQNPPKTPKNTPSAAPLPHPDFDQTRISLNHLTPKKFHPLPHPIEPGHFLPPAYTHSGPGLRSILIMGWTRWLVPVVAGAVGWHFLRPRRSFRGGVAVITGGSRGLGLAIAQRLIREAATVHLLARDPAELDRAAEILRADGGTVEVWPCDVRDKSRVHEVLGAIGAKSGGIDLLVNNAGIIVVSLLENLTEEDFGDAMNTHFWAPLLVTNAALPFLKNRRGRIVNIASIGGRLAVPHLASYSASKFALVGLSDALRAELAAEGIRVTTVSPGLMRTGSHIQARFKGDPDREFSWFSLGATLPGLSVSAERAARLIVDAAKTGRAELTISPQARLAVVAQAIAPGLVAAVMKLVNGFLPKGEVRELRRGKDCSSEISPSLLTTLGDRASQRLNEEG